ncbi:caspase family protein [Rhodobacteraceae bacterium F11138]|nr:caspase family protein [Rhodobacteraceae bacterium F11138]
MRAAIFVFLSLLCFPISAHAEKRIGLVIGNDLYSDVPRLNKAAADATAISETLNGQGFDIVTVLNANRREMNRKISTFTEQLEPGDTAFVFFAGHGVEIDGENYLLPTDILAPASGERDFIKAESIALSGLLDRVRATGARMTIAIVDACRNNPFQTTTGRSIGGTRGLGRITAPQGTFVIFSAGAGQLALDELDQDDPAENSVFTRTLVPRLSQPGLELRSMVADLRVEVRNLARTVNHNQFPAYYDELLGDFYFADPQAAKTETLALATIPTETDAPTRTMTDDPMRADFELARSIGTTDALQTFVNRYTSRSDEFSYRMALQLLDQKRRAPAPGEPAATSGAKETPDRTAAHTERRAIIRDTQAALNAAGCSAGAADGVAGPRTRRALQRFITDTGASVSLSDLGTRRALNAVLQRGSETCTKTVAAPAPATGKPAGLKLTGTWRYTATCALLIKVTGTTRFRKTGANAYQGNLSDSLGQKAHSEVYLNDRELTGTDYYPGITVKWRGRMAADGNSFTASGSTGCSVYASRAG